VTGTLPARTLRLRVAYDGTGLVGWQRQAEGTSVQGLLEEALGRLAGAAVTVHGAGRTDAGVHASGQVASVTLSVRIDASTVRRALNATLPPAVRVLEVTDAPRSFHARYSARSKTYEYRMVNGPVAPPAALPTCWHVPYALDVAAMMGEAAALVGEHDFSSFRSTGGAMGSAVRRVLESSVGSYDLRSLAASPQLAPVARIEPARLLVYTVRGTGFLRHMVRAIVGTLVDVGAGRRPRGTIARLLAAAASRDEAGATAPPQGLCLAAVEYDDPGEVAAHR
jgi:tRNA pseudouridine38-40 synthase